MEYISHLIVLMLVACVVSVSESARRDHGPRATDNPCRVCDMRSCPMVTHETCDGQIVKDECDCCPVCVSEDDTVIFNITQSENSSCSSVSCPKHKICVMNIQNIPTCRCPSAFWCRRIMEKEEKETVCGEDGRKYRSKCHVQIEECTQNKKIRLEKSGIRCEKKLKKTVQNVTEPSVNLNQWGRNKPWRQNKPARLAQGKKNQKQDRPKHHRLSTNQRQALKVKRQQAKAEKDKLRPGHPLRSTSKDDNQRKFTLGRKHLPALEEKPQQRTKNPVVQKPHQKGRHHARLQRKKKKVPTATLR